MTCSMTHEQRLAPSNHIFHLVGSLTSDSDDFNTPLEHFITPEIAKIISRERRRKCSHLQKQTGNSYFKQLIHNYIMKDQDNEFQLMSKLNSCCNKFKNQADNLEIITKVVKITFSISKFAKYIPVNYF